MSLPHPLETLYQEWRALTEAESAAIAAAAWPRVADLQDAKARLQPAILKVNAELEPSASGRPEDVAWREPLKRMLADLIDLEEHNQASVARQLAALRQERQARDLSSRNLRRLQHSYAAGNRGFWERYS
jgi:hypothetical protein